MSTILNPSCALFLALLLILGGVSGCAGGKTTTVTTTTVTRPSQTDLSPAATAYSQGTAAPGQETTVTTTTTEEKESSPGVVGSAFGLVGAVIALPFRVVGGVLGAVF